MSKTIDFDQFRAEQKGEPLIVKLGGREWHLPASPAAELALDVIRWQSENLDVVPPDKLMDLARGLLTAELLEFALHEQRLSMDELWALLNQVSEVYTAQASGPNRETRRVTKRRNRSTSSARGRSSSRTSSASTESTFAQA
jgi:hypothetical protein